MSDKHEENRDILVADIECNGFLRAADKIWCIVIGDYLSGHITRYVGDEIAEGIVRLLEADKVCGHNIITFDVPVIEKIACVTFDRSRLWDTLTMSRLFFPERTINHLNHGLDAWGKTLNFPKGKFKNFSRFSPEMVDYCEQDVRLTMLVLGQIIERIAANEAAGYAA